MTKAILRVLEEGTPELRIAAAQILGEVRPSDAAVVNALGVQLQRGEPYLARYVLEALAKINTKGAIKELVARVGETGPEGDLVAHLLRSAGDQVAPMLCEVFDDSDLPTQMRILEILGEQASADAAEVMEKALYTPELTAIAGDALVAGLADAIPGNKLRYFKDRLKKAITKGESASEVQGQLLRLLAHVDPKGARAALVKATEPGNPPGVRHAALESLAEIALTPTQAVAMLDYLTDNDARVVEATAELLTSHDKWSPTGVAQLRKLLSSRREPLRLFAIRAFRSVPSADVVKTLVQHLLGDVPAMSEAASEALSHNPKAVDALLRALSHEK
ncbi:MAG: hypothetical protein KDB80_14365, partial [Planctomycetes bacterium]|nr:hypothetical protein [Planctomycetota bacterium]